MNALKKTVQFGLPNLRTWIQCAAWSRLAKHLLPNAGTLIVLGLLLLTQSVRAEPVSVPQAQGTTTLLSYQGTLTNKSGTPINGGAEMVFTLYHQAEGGTPFWTEAYTGAQKIVVTAGQFHVLLGSQTALNPAGLTGDLYLGIRVNGEEMVPREALVAVPHAMWASAVPDGSITTAKINMNDNLDMHGWEFVNARAIGAHSSDHFDLLYTQNNELFIKSFATGGGVHIGAGGAVPLDVSGDASIGGNASIMGLNLQLGPSIALRQDGGRALHLLPWGGAGHAWDDVCIGCGSNAGLIVRGNVSCGALTEANLQTEEERDAGRIDRFEEGDVLCWANDRLEKCSAANDPLVQAVADANGKPIVIGAEVIKVLGPVHTGDLLVASDTPGYAIVNNDPRPGAVMAQALEDFDGAQGLIKAMIRKF